MDTATETNALQKTFEASQSAVVDSFRQAWEQVIAVLPNVVAAMIVLVLGYVISRFVSHAISVLSEKLGLQTAADRSGLAESMRHMGINRNVPAIIGTIVFWLLLCVFLTASFNILGWKTLSDTMQAVAGYIPKLLVATVVVVVGLLVASFIRGVVATSADRVGISYADNLATGCYYILAGLTFIAAFERLDLQFKLLEQLILIGAGGLALGFAVAFGMGGRDAMAGILAGYYVRQRLHAGDHVSVGSLEGIVREVGATATVIETEEDGMINRRSVPNTKMLHEAVR